MPMLHLTEHFTKLAWIGWAVCACWTDGWTIRHLMNNSIMMTITAVNTWTRMDFTQELYHDTKSRYFGRPSHNIWMNVSRWIGLLTRNPFLMVCSISPKCIQITLTVNPFLDYIQKSLRVTLLNYLFLNGPWGYDSQRLYCFLWISVINSNIL